MRRFPHPGFEKRSAGTIPHVRNERKTPDGTQQETTDIDFSPECMEAFDRLVTLAHQLSAVLTGDELSPETGKTQTPRSAGADHGHALFPASHRPGRSARAVLLGEVAEPDPVHAHPCPSRCVTRRWRRWCLEGVMKDRPPLRLACANHLSPARRGRGSANHQAARFPSETSKPPRGGDSISSPPSTGRGGEVRRTETEWGSTDAVGSTPPPSPISASRNDATRRSVARQSAMAPILSTNQRSDGMHLGEGGGRHHQPAEGDVAGEIDRRGDHDRRHHRHPAITRREPLQPDRRRHDLAASPGSPPSRSRAACPSPRPRLRRGDVADVVAGAHQRDAHSASRA